MLRVRELTSAREDRAALRAFYEGLYVSEFPDADERESLGNIERYLELKARGWYELNDYHVLLFLDEADRCVAGSISDYLAGPNAGVIEFLVVDRRHRGRGLGTEVRLATEATLVANARARAGIEPTALVAEIEDPCLVEAAPGSIDPFLRAAIWAKWGYRRLDFPYVQPALSPAQRPVRHLMMAMKALRPEYRQRVPVALVTHILREYMRWAMRIPDPERAAEYVEMRAALERAGHVPVAPIARVLDEDESRPLAAREVAGPDDPDLEPVRDVYRAAFTDPAMAVPADALGGHPGRGDFDHHLWALRAAPADPVGGMASFFSFRGMGFGGYLAFGAALRGRGYLRPVLARIEQQMVRDCRGVRGWLIECADDPTAARFERLGFHQVPVAYRQPAFGGTGQPGPLLRLLYREIGGDADTELRGQDLLDALAWIYTVVYGLDEPRRDALYGEVERAVRAWPAGLTRWAARQ